MNNLKAEDFAVGQEVMCRDPNAFLSSKASYLKNRVGIVQKVWPSNAPKDMAMRRNEVKVRWQKRNGRGVEKEMIMCPRDLVALPPPTRNRIGTDMKFELDFRPVSETPTERGSYLLYNQCDGYHIAEAWFIDGEFITFAWFADGPVDKDFYCAWALLPDGTKTLYDAFAKKTAPVTAMEE